MLLFYAIYYFGVQFVHFAYTNDSPIKFNLDLYEAIGSLRGVSEFF